MLFRISFVGLAILLACSSDNPENGPAELAVVRAAAVCGSSRVEMQWLKLIIEESRKDVAMSGRIYTFQSNGQTVFMHQPWIMSCLGCILYDCNGRRLGPSEIDQSSLSNGFKDLTVIYDPPI